MDETTQAPPPQGARPGSGVTIQRPVIVAMLYLANIFVGFSVFVGLVLAYIWRGEDVTQEWEKTHYTYLIRTFWIGVVVFFAVFVLWFAVIFGVAFDQAGADPSAPPPPGPEFVVVIFGGIIVWLLSAVWFCIRCVLSLVRAGDRRPMPNPETWLF